MRRKVFNKTSEITTDDKRLIEKRKRSLFSSGELAIANFCKENGIEFFKEWFFKELKVRGKLKLLFFDFYLPEYNLCIEFDGIQHYTKEFHGKKLVNQETNDFLKSAFLKSKNIKLLRIKYDQIENVESIICQYFDKHF
jgi:very-short-patch-repair endonuclease